MSDEEEMFARLRVTPGGVESAEEKDRERIISARDPQLERAMDVLKAINLFTERAPEVESPKARSAKVANAK